MCDVCTGEYQLLNTKPPICMDCFRFVSHGDAIKYGLVIECYGPLNEAISIEYTIQQSKTKVREELLQSVKRKAALIYFMHAECYRLGKGLPYYYIVDRKDNNLFEYELKGSNAVRKPIEEHHGLDTTYKEDEKNYNSPDFIERMVSEYAMCNYDKVIEYYTKASQLGYDEATMGLAFCYHCSHGVPKDDAKFVSIMMDLVNKNFIPAIGMLGRLVNAGVITNSGISKQRSLEMMRMAAGMDDETIDDPRAIYHYYKVVDQTFPKKDIDRMVERGLNSKRKGIANSEFYFIYYNRYMSLNADQKKEYNKKNNKMRGHEMSALRLGAQLGSINARKYIADHLLISDEEAYEANI
jgi:hypothetical protein